MNPIQRLETLCNRLGGAARHIMASNATLADKLADLLDISDLVGTVEQGADLVEAVVAASEMA